MDTLIREGNPPAGQLASPVPQVWDPTANGGAGGWVRVYGEHHASRAILYGPNGQPISTANRLPVEATLTGQSVETYLVEPTVTDGSISSGLVHTRGYRNLKIVVYVSGGKWRISAYSTASPLTTGYIRAFNETTGAWERAIGADHDIQINGQGRYLLNSHPLLDNIISKSDMFNILLDPLDGSSGTVWIKLLGEKYDDVE